jgi:acid phosphatase family membrane protein YuiD
MFTEYHVIQFILQYLITKPEGHSAQTTPFTVSFGTEQYHSTNCLQSTVQSAVVLNSITVQSAVVLNSITVQSAVVLNSITDKLFTVHCTVSCGTEQDHSTNGLQSPVQSPVVLNSITVKTGYSPLSSQLWY